MIPGAVAANAALIRTNIAGNDPQYQSASQDSGSAAWDGSFPNTDAGATLGTTYYWGTWQQRSAAVDGGSAWREESLLFPIVFK